MQMYTYYTSFLFLLTSFRTAGSWLQTWLAIQACVSILHHAKYYDDYPGKKMVQYIDRVVGHYIGIRSLIEALSVSWTKYTYPNLIIYYTCLMYMTIVYHCRLRTVDDWPLHKTFHFAGAIGILSLYRILYPFNPTCIQV